MSYKFVSWIHRHKVGFQYPTQQVQQLYDITLQVSLSSRVAVLGPNDSSKSTLVKLLIGDMEANKGGEIWKHPNLVIGYATQRAFHRINLILSLLPTLPDSTLGSTSVITAFAGHFVCFDSV